MTEEKVLTERIVVAVDSLDVARVLRKVKKGTPVSRYAIERLKMMHGGRDENGKKYSMYDGLVARGALCTEAELTAKLEGTAKAKTQVKADVDADAEKAEVEAAKADGAKAKEEKAKAKKKTRRKRKSAE